VVDRRLITNLLWGLCHCGCGQQTTVPEKNDARNGCVKGQPMRYVRGHNSPEGPPLESQYSPEDRGYSSECWVWNGTLTVKGYGRASRGGRPRAAHRLVYEKHVGPIPEGLQLDHLCGVRECVNPDHLEPVTNAENSRRGRNTRLTRSDVDEIRSLRGIELQREIALRFGISPSYVSTIQSGRVWKNG
jgi:hypothetical protein